MPIKKTKPQIVTSKILLEVYKERQSQDEKWGEQNHPILPTGLINHPNLICESYRIPNETTAKKMVDIGVNTNSLTYFDIFLEEVCESASCGNDVKHLREELIQCAAVVVAMVESLDRNGR